MQGQEVLTKIENYSFVKSCGSSISWYLRGAYKGIQILTTLYTLS